MVMAIQIAAGVLGTVSKDLEKSLGKLEIGGRIETISNRSIIEIVKNTGKLKRLDVTQTPMKNN